MIKRALISVSDRTGIFDLAKELQRMGVEVISTGGTLNVLAEQGIKATPVTGITGYPEILDGRYKTLHPAVFAAIMADRNNSLHMDQLNKLHIDPIDMVIINLYPFKETLLKGNVDISQAIEKIDIGGPALIRSAALNYKDCLVLVDPDDYGPVMEELRETHAVSVRNRYRMAYKAFSHTSHYDTLIQDYFRSKINDDAFPETITLTYEKVQDLRYGENPHQKAAFYREVKPVVGCIPSARQLHGKELSFNNINDANGAVELLKEFDEPTVAAVKHANPCGVGSDLTILGAYRKAYSADPESIFGGVIAANREIDEKTAKEISLLFVDVVIAPSFSQNALQILSARKNIRLLIIEHMEKKLPDGSMDFKKVGGGILIQNVNNQLHKVLSCVTLKEPDSMQYQDLAFAMKVAKHTRSNAIVIVKDKKTLGIGQGQSSRINAARIAIQACKDEVPGAVMASDAFFPFPDTVEAAVEAGISAIIQPGGSIKDNESIDACNKHGISMIFTGMRHFKH